MLFALTLGLVLQTAAVSQQGSSQDPSLAITPRHQKEIDSDVEMGKKAVAEIAKLALKDPTLRPTADTKMQERVERIGNQLAAIADSHHLIALWGDKQFSPFKYTFTVLAGSDVNAFSIPGGHIYLYEGIVKYAETDDELAGVIGHEISHAAFRHVAILNHKAGQLQALTIPLILVSIFAGGGQAAGLGIVGSLLNTAIPNGWSVEAEKAADYGGFQILTYSHYNPVGMLTMMERLARDERLGPATDWGIFRDHPPGPERANALIAELNAAHIPIRRSEVSTSFRAIVQAGTNGTANLMFNGQHLHAFAGDDALRRADASVDEINVFFDSMPEVYEPRLAADGNIYGHGRMLIEITQADADAAKMSRAQLGAQTLKAIKNALFTYGTRVWQSD